MTNATGFKAYMALFITIAVVGFLYLIVYLPIPGQSKDAILLVLGALLMRLADVFSFYFGSSEGSQRKTEIIGGANVTAAQEQ
jgi:predicted CDP-diglyceride synthetase/phosphatidate cytidylyltransferase